MIQSYWMPMLHQVTLYTSIQDNIYYWIYISPPTWMRHDTLNILHNIIIMNQHNSSSTTDRINLDKMSSRKKSAWKAILNPKQKFQIYEIYLCLLSIKLYTNEHHLNLNFIIVLINKVFLKTMKSQSFYCNPKSIMDGGWRILNPNLTKNVKQKYFLSFLSLKLGTCLYMQLNIYIYARYESKMVSTYKASTW